jgi:hypothetical protein
MKSPFLLIAAIFLLSSCEKKPFDYRNKYLGEYHFTYQYHVTYNGGGSQDTSIYYDGSIHDGEDGFIKVDWYSGNPREFEVSKDGKLTLCNTSLGSMSKESFVLTYNDNLCSPGPLGTDYTVTLSGEKL